MGKELASATNTEQPSTLVMVQRSGSMVLQHPHLIHLWVKRLTCISAFGVKKFVKVKRQAAPPPHSPSGQPCSGSATMPAIQTVDHFQCNSIAAVPKKLCLPNGCNANNPLYACVA
eukprot:1160079-Pelagomonas_calceolata.AAC.15